MSPEGKHCGQVLFVSHQCFYLCRWRCRATPLLLLQTKGHYPLGRLAELKHVVGLTKQPPKTLPTMQVHQLNYTHTLEKLILRTSNSPPNGGEYVCNMSLFLVACLLNRWPRASSRGKVPTKQGQRLDHTTKLRRSLPFPKAPI